MIEKGMFEKRFFRDGGVILSYGDKGMYNDLVFAGGAMEAADPLLKEQVAIVDYILKAIEFYEESYNDDDM